MYLQTWCANVHDSNRLRTYATFKFNLTTEKYLTVVTNYRIRKSLSKFRYSNHTLMIESGRKDGIEFENRICKMCSQNVVEDEYHFLLECPLYNSLRNKYLLQYNNRNQHTFHKLLTTSSVRVINNLALYVHLAFKVRSSHLVVNE